MKRTVILGSLVLTGALSLAVAAYQAPQGGRGGGTPGPVEVEKLKDNLYILKGGGGNTAVFIQANGVTVVDTKNPGWGQPILDKIKELTPKPVTTIVNTHTHGDHVSGNVQFPASVDIIVQENAAESMKKMPIFAQSDGRGLPKRTFKDTMRLGSGADEVDLFYFGRGHTNGDAWILFPSLRVLHGGDIFAWTNQLPIIDVSAGGSGVDLPDTLMKAHSALSKRADSIITGHSTVMTFDDLRKWADFNRSFLNAVQAGKAAGKSAEEIAKAWTAPAGMNAQPNRVQGNVQTILNELK